MAATADADVSPPLEPLTAAVAMPAGSVSGGPAGPTAKGHRFGEDAMQTPQDVEQMRSLHGMGWSQRAIARERCGGTCGRACQAASLGHLPQGKRQRPYGRQRFQPWPTQTLLTLCLTPPIRRHGRARAVEPEHPRAVGSNTMVGASCGSGRGCVKTWRMP